MSNKILVATAAKSDLSVINSELKHGKFKNMNMDQQIDTAIYNKILIGIRKVQLLKQAEEHFKLIWCTCKHKGKWDKNKQGFLCHKKGMPMVICHILNYIED